VSIVLLFLLGLLFYRSHQKNADISLLILTIILIASGNFLSTLPDNIPYIFANVLMGLGLITLFLHYERIARDTPNRSILIIICMLYACVLLITFLILWYLESDSGASIGFIGSLLISFNHPDFVVHSTTLIRINVVSIIAIIVFIRAIQIITKVHRLTHLGATRNELIGLYLLLLYRILMLPVSWVSIELLSPIMSISLIISILGLLILMGNYLKNPDYLYLLPFPIHSFMVYNKMGLLCYSRKVQQNRLAMDDQDVLISGAFTAISALINETLGAQAKIRHINAQQFQIFFNSLPEERGSFVVIAYGATGLFEKALKRFISLMTPHFFELLNAAGMDIDVLEKEIDGMIKKAFPFVQIDVKKEE
jgi:hypothetical protein